MNNKYTRLVFCLCMGIHLTISIDISMAIDEQKILPNDPAEGDQFGYAVDMSGDFMIIGSQEDDDMGGRSGSAYIFKQQTGGWIQYAKLVAPDGTSGAQFGYSVSISGDYALVGAFRDKENGNQSGAAYMFRHDGTTWIFVQKITPITPEQNSEFGNSVDTDGNYAVIGAHRAEHLSAMTGAVYVFERNGLNWVEDAKLVENELGQGSFYGCDCKLSGNTLVVGANGFDGSETSTGAVYVYEHDGVTWSLKQKLIASDESKDANFGQSLAIWNQWILIGADGADGQYTDSGAGYMFHKTSGSWMEYAKLLPVDPFPGGGFGYSVDLISEYAIIGAPFHGDLPNDTGRASIFVLNGSEWVSHLSMKASDETEGSRFGWSVTIQPDECCVGALYASDGEIESGAAYVFSDYTTVPPTATPSVFTYDIELYDDDLAAGDLFLLDRTYGNPSVAVDVDEYILLDIYGAYWFWPDWTTQVDFESWTIPATGNGHDAILQFEWPEVEGELTGLKFWAAILHAGSSTLILYDMEEWGYSNK